MNRTGHPRIGNIDPTLSVATDSDLLTSTPRYMSVQLMRIMRGSSDMTSSHSDSMLCSPSLECVLETCMIESMSRHQIDITVTRFVTAATASEARRAAESGVVVTVDPIHGAGTVIAADYEGATEQLFIQPRVTASELPVWQVDMEWTMHIDAIDELTAQESAEAAVRVSENAASDPYEFELTAVA